MSTTTTNYGFEKPGGNDAPSLPIWVGGLADAVDTALHAQVAGTTGTWTPTAAGFSPTLPGTWSGTWRRIGDLIFAQASITTTASYTVSSWPTDWSVSGLPVTASNYGAAMAYQSWGNLPWPAAVDGSTIYIHTTSKTASNIATGSVIRVAATYLVSGS